MYIITEEHCQNCRMLKTMLGDKFMSVHFKLASQNMDECRRLGIKTIPALVKDDETVIFDLEEIVNEVERRVNNG